MHLDLVTVVFLVGTIGILLVLFSWTLALARSAPPWRQPWAWGNTALLVGVVLFLTQGQLTPWISVVLANGLVLLGYHLLEHSLRVFAGRPWPRAWLITIGLVFVVAFLGFLFVWNVFAVRLLAYTLLVVGVWTRILVLLRGLPEYQTQRGLLRTFMVLAAVILVAQVARAVIAVQTGSTTVLAAGDSFAALLLISILVLVAWALGFITLELARIRRHLEDALDTRDTMIQLIAHDLRGPLGGQVGLLESMRGEGQCQDSPDMIDLLALSAQRSHDLLENLLDWAQNQRGTLELHPTVLGATTLFERALEPYRTVAQAKGITVHLEPCADKVLVDERTMTTILRNLISNALKFTPPEGRLELRFDRTPEWGAFRVRDSGAGLSDETLRRFEAGESIATTAGTDHESGSGLGLNLCRDLARRNGARLHFEVGPGTTAVVTFPAAVVS